MSRTFRSAEGLMRDSPNLAEMVMRCQRALCVVTFALFAAVGSPASAQVPETAVGSTVKDMVGGVVGVITAVDGSDVTVRTDKHEVRLPASSMAGHNETFLIAMSRDQLNNAVERVLAATQQGSVTGVAASATGHSDTDTPSS